MSKEKVEKIVYSPIVSTDSISPEAKLMRAAKELEVQSDVDTKYDAIVERFEQRSTKPLLGVAVALFLLFGASFIRRR